jgi:monoamine oxidase
LHFSLQFSHGCVASLAVGDLHPEMDMNMHWRGADERVHWAGTECATHWMGYISGAIDAGMRCAREVVERGV